MIIINGQFPFLPGKANEGKAAARRLRERVLREDVGVLLYDFYTDEFDKTLTVVEVYVDEKALRKHVDASDFSGVFSAIDHPAGTVKVYGSLCTDVQNLLASFGPFEQATPV